VLHLSVSHEIINLEKIFAGEMVKLP
jgi:hypothetical protein